jgi:hypothetical protein
VRSGGNGFKATGFISSCGIVAAKFGKIRLRLFNAAVSLGSRHQDRQEPIHAQSRRLCQGQGMR